MVSLDCSPTPSPFAAAALPLQLTTLSAPVLVVAPHPDDETLGCGGAIAQLRARGCPVHVLVVSDGTRSHLRSQQYPPPRLKQVRQAETLAALSLFQVEAEHVTFLGLPDGEVPHLSPPDHRPPSSAAQIVLERCQTYLRQTAPQTIFLPYRFDPHRDHRASWQLVQGAIREAIPAPVASLLQPPRCLEYPIWDWDPGQRRPLAEGYKVWRLDVAAQVDLKRQAIHCYRSQTTDLIADDPTGFRLLPELIANFLHPWEIYLEPTP
ncbi:PIG-L deacetylase family protein [Phormidium tenue]|uniref:PIG-L domain-containing protein n=1 Tax=Phormidium tenue NIES-30 TaxID=549789 RepID=A0A1U7IYQ4_9CYAN|nr:PIG-L deacetylase family protein [Phormidium tenue]MBD2234701.1 PIG-L family deacetylase [Phormidium tenue FACHB-1052]OKH43978.1 PIG-L domain-containing protein [Phormidium tenue NIES-30]